MATQDGTSTSFGDPFRMAAPTIQEMQHWTGVMGRAQQMVLEYIAGQAKRVGTDASMPDFSGLLTTPPVKFGIDTGALFKAQSDFWKDSLSLWQRLLNPAGLVSGADSDKKDRRFAAPQWHDHPFYAMIRQTYQLVSGHMLRGLDVLDGLSPKQREQIRFAMTAFVDAMSPTNFALTNPEVMSRMIETRGESLLKGLEHLLDDLTKGQLTQTAMGFELGRDLAATPGKVIYETPVFQLIHYAPVTKDVHEIPLVIFPAWINRFYILDLGPEKSFVRWVLEQGVSVFMVSWKSADASLAGMTFDDYAAAQIEAVDIVRDLLGVEGCHTIGYCVAGTTLAATLALLAARGEAEKIRSATFLVSQVDFSKAGDLTLFVDDAQLDLLSRFAGDKGFIDGRYLAATFNLLRGRDLIWNFVVNNYLMGDDYRPFDLLFWNGDTTNLPSGWHQAYLRDLYRDNLMVVPGGISIAGTPIDLGKVETPSYVQAGRDDHIAPAESVWKLTEHFAGPSRFLLAGSGHIAGVVNPPASGKYQYWTSDAQAPSLTDFIATATETKGSWWPDWIRWLEPLSGAMVPAKGARKPGKGKLAAIEDAPGRYVKLR